VCSLAPAWRVACRDRYIGWNEAERRAGLSRIANNKRFLILPAVWVPHLAGHLLGKISRRISADWNDKYGHPLALLETYVENNRLYAQLQSRQTESTHQIRLALPLVFTPAYTHRGRVVLVTPQEIDVRATIEQATWEKRFYR
jgi:hypothetical protein